MVRRCWARICFLRWGNDMTEVKYTPPGHLIYGLDDTPPPGPAILAAIQHILASIVGIVTPTLVIGGALGLGEHVPYLIAMSLFVSGVATFIQCRRIGPVGSGLLSLQGTSFAFLGSILAAGFAVKGRGGTPEDILAMIFGLCLVGCVIEIVLSQFINKLSRIVTPTVTGIVITVIGLSLVKVGFTDFAGGFGAGKSLVRRSIWFLVKSSSPPSFSRHSKAIRCFGSRRSWSG